MTKILRNLFFICILIWNPLALANEWRFSIAPYLWAINMNGDVGIGPIKAHVAEDFGDILKHFKGGGMLWLEADKDRFGLFANFMYAVLSVDSNDYGFTIHSKSKFGLYSFGASYTFCDFIQPYIGARITSNDASVNILHTSLAASDNHTWTDPIIGLRINYDFNRNWHMILAGDIGGTNFNNHKSCNVNGFIGYTPTSIKSFTAYFGYRWLDQHYATGSGIKYFLWNMKIFGPVLGLSFSF